MSRSQAVDSLTDILSEALAEHPNIQPFLIDFWRFCRRAAAQGRDLDNLPIPSELFKNMGGGTSKPTGSGNAYVTYKEWMCGHRYGGEPILAVAAPVRPGRCTTYSVHLPFCKGDPWRSVTARLEQTTASTGLTPTQLRSIRKRVSESAPYRMWFLEDGVSRDISLAETTCMAVFHALLTSRGAKPHLVARWPDRYGVALAAWRRERPGPYMARIPQPYLLVHVALPDEGLEPFEQAIAAAPTAERLLICVGKPTEKLRSEARAKRVHVIHLFESNPTDEG